MSFRKPRSGYPESGIFNGLLDSGFGFQPPRNDNIVVSVQKPEPVHASQSCAKRMRKKACERRHAKEGMLVLEHVALKHVARAEWPDYLSDFWLLSFMNNQVR
ncbi:MAG: hypothetical protein RL194_1195 [Pseudomonadota bacterium]|jgi:hypothetical protein